MKEKMKKRPVGREIRYLDNLLKRYIESSCKCDEINAGISSTNNWVIGFIADKERRGEDAFQRDIEKEFGVTRSTASKVINLMVEKELVVRESVGHDARLKKLRLTGKAEAALESMHENLIKIEENLTRGISAEELDIFYKCLQQMKDNIHDNID